MEQERFILDPSKISTSEDAKNFRKGTTEQVLLSRKREELKSFDTGDLVTTLEGSFAHQGLMVVEKKDNGMVRIAPAPNTPTIEIEELKLYHFDDYHEAFKVALIEAQTLNPDKPQ